MSVRMRARNGQPPGLDLPLLDKLQPTSGALAVDIPVAGPNAVRPTASAARPYNEKNSRFRVVTGCAFYETANVVPRCGKAKIGSGPRPEEPTEGRSALGVEFYICGRSPPWRAAARRPPFSPTARGLVMPSLTNAVTALPHSKAPAAQPNIDRLLSIRTR